MANQEIRLLAIFSFLILYTINSTQSQAPTTVTPNGGAQPQQQQPLEDLQHTLHRFLYQLHSNTQQVAEQSAAQNLVVAPPQPPQHPPLLFPAGIQQHGERPNPLVPLGPPSLFPSSLLVPTPAHLPSTFRLPATVMAQHKAFPMEGPPPHPMLVFSSIVEQQPKRSIFGIGAAGNNNGTEGPPTSSSTTTYPTTLKTGPLDTMLHENTVPNPATTVSDENNSADTVEEEPVALRAKPPQAVPILPAATNGTDGVTVEEDNSTTTSTTVSEAVAKPLQEASLDGYGSQKHIFLVPGGGGKTAAENGTTKGSATTAVDLEAFLRSANMSAGDTKLFLGLVERVLEQEVTRRLEKTLATNNTISTDPDPRDGAGAERNRSPPNISVKTDDGRQIVLELPKQNDHQQSAADEAALLQRDLAERVRLSQKELKTANTRLFSLASGEEQQQAPTDQRIGHQQQQGVISLKSGNTSAPKSRPLGTTMRESIEREAADYKQREQAEFDRLLDQLRAEEGGGAGGGGPADVNIKSGAVTKDDADLLLIVPPKVQQSLSSVSSASATTTVAPPVIASSTVATTPSPAATTTMVSPAATPAAPTSATISAQPQQQQQMMLNRQHQFWSRHGPKTKFERLVEDYRWRLSGQDSQNGLNDLIKALRNANIGFYDRLSNPTAVKILKRID